jgi:hypothetical protein
MRKIAALISGLAVIAVVTAVAAAPAGAAIRVVQAAPSGYQLVYTDDFSGTALDSSNWGYRQNSNTSESNVTVSGGQLHLNMTRVSTSTGLDGYRGAGIVSKQKFGYGYYEVTAKLTNDNGGWHPSFWTQIWDGQAAKPVYNTQFTEMDIFEKESATDLNAGYYTWNDTSSGDAQLFRSSRVSLPGDNYSAFHTYGALYGPTSMTFYRDGVNEGSVTYTTASVPNSPMALWLSTIPLHQPDLDSSQPVGHSYGSFDVDSVSYYTTTGTVPTTSPATVRASVTSYSNDFESGTAANWSTNGQGSFSVVTDGAGKVYKNSSASGEPIALYSGDGTFSPSWINYSVEAGVKVTSSGGGAGIVGRYADVGNYYYLRLNPSTNAIELLKKVVNTVYSLASYPLTVSTSTVYNLKLSMNDATISASLNGAQILSVTDRSLASGKFGVKGYTQPFSVDHVTLQTL